MIMASYATVKGGRDRNMVAAVQRYSSRTNEDAGDSWVNRHLHREFRGCNVKYV